MQEMLEALKAILTILSQSDQLRLVFALGVLLVLLGCYIAYKAINSPPQETTGLRKMLLWSFLGLGFLAIVIGPSVSVYQRLQSARTFSPMPTKEAMDRLRTNAPVRWLARLIVRANDAAALDLSQLKRLGREDQEFTFVADYEELVGRTAAEAARMLGSRAPSDQKILAILFPLNGNIIPVNARGLLQVIADVQSEKAVSPTFAYSIDTTASAALNSRRRPSWAFDSYKTFYPQYCIAAQTFRCEARNTAAASLIGELSDDWHPLGFARRRPVQDDPCQPLQKLCQVTNWETAENTLTDTYGARVFLIKNKLLSELAGRVLIDFDQPEKQRIPSLLLGPVTGQED